MIIRSIYTFNTHYIRLVNLEITLTYPLTYFIKNLFSIKRSSIN